MRRKLIKLITTAVLSASIILPSVDFTVFAQENPVEIEDFIDGDFIDGTTDYESGEGTSDDPYIIANASQLKTFLTTLPSGKFFKLKTDIDMVDEGSITIPNKTSTVVFNGNEKTISNLIVASDDASTVQSIGVFGGTNATVTKLTLNNLTVIYKGGMSSAYIYGFGNTGIYSGCKLTGDFKFKSESTSAQNYYISGIAENPTILKSCEYAAKLVVDSECFPEESAIHTLNISGIANKVTENAEGLVEDCVNSGHIEAPMGIICGIVHESPIGMKNCSTTEKAELILSGTDSYTQGNYVCGIANNLYGNVDNCDNNGKVSGEKVYGITHSYRDIYKYDDHMTFSNCDNNGQLEANKEIGILIGNVGDLSIANSIYISKCTNTANIETDAEILGLFANITTKGYVEVKECENKGNLTSNKSCVAGITAKANANTQATDGVLIDSCVNSGNLTSYSENTGFTSGIVAGINLNQESYRGMVIVNNCSNTGNIKAKGTFDDASGVVGIIYKGLVSNCSNSGSIEGKNAAGIVVKTIGDNEDKMDASLIIITKSYNTGDITSSQLAGGIVAEHASGEVTYCYNTGKISRIGTSSYARGGICGWAGSAALTPREYNNIYVYNCFNAGKIDSSSETASTIIGGIIGKVAFNDGMNSGVTGTVMNVYNVGSIQKQSGNKTTASNVAAIIGEAAISTGTFNVTNAYFKNQKLNDNTAITAIAKESGAVKVNKSSITGYELVNMTKQQAYPGFDFEKTAEKTEEDWYFNTEFKNYKYPILKAVKMSDFNIDDNGSGDPDPDDPTPTDKEVESIKIDPSDFYMTVGGASKKITIIYEPADAKIGTNVSFESSNEEVATVSSEGVVTAKNAGEAIITATSEKGKKATATVHVEKRKPKDIVLSAASNDMLISDEPMATTIKIYPSVVSFDDIKDGLTYSVKGINGKEASVKISDDGKIIPVKVGTSIVTATLAAEKTESGEVKSSSIVILVLANRELYAVSGMDYKLSDLSDALCDGWEFANPSMKIDDFYGRKKRVGIEYTGDDEMEASAVVNVTPVTFEASLVMSDDSQMITYMSTKDTKSVRASYGKNVTADVIASITARGYVLDSELKDSEGIITVDKSGNNYELKSGSSDGESSLVLTVYVKAGSDTKELSSKDYTVNVVDTSEKGVANIEYDIVIKEASGYKKLSPNGSIYVVKTSDEVYIRNLTKPYDSAKVNNSLSYSAYGCIDVGEAEGDYTRLLLDESGYGSLQIKADDAYGSTELIKFFAVNSVYSNANVGLDKYSVTLNTNKSAISVSVNVLLPSYVKITDAKLVDRNGDASVISSVNKLSASVKEDNVVTITGSADSKGTKAYLQITLDSQKEPITIKSPINIIVSNKTPKVSVKQLDKLDTYYANGSAAVVVSVPGEKIVAVTGNTADKYEIVFEDSDYNRSSITGVVKVKDKTVASELKSNTINLNVKLDGYAQPIPVNLKVLTTSTVTSLEDKDGSIYVGINKIVSTRLYNKTLKSYENLTADTTVKITNSADYVASIDADNNILNIETKSEKQAGKTDKLVVQIKTPNMREAQEYKYDIKYVDAKKLALSVKGSTLDLYNYGDKNCDSTSAVVSIKGGSNSNLLSKIKLDGKYDGLEAYTVADSRALYLRVQIKDNAIKAGTYPYKLTLRKEDIGNGATKDLTAKITVKVKAAAGKNTAKVTTTTKGKLDALNRSSALRVTPKFSNLIVDDNTKVSVSLKGKDASLFALSTEGLSKGVADIRIKSDEGVLTKNKYQVYFRYVVEKGDDLRIVLNSPVNTIMVNQSKPKITMNKEAIFAFNKVNMITEEIILTNSSGEQIDIEKIEASIDNKAITFSNANGTFTIQHDPSVGTTAKGKSYKVTLNVYPKGAADNEKPINASYTVKIAK